MSGDARRGCCEWQARKQNGAPERALMRKRRFTLSATCVSAHAKSGASLRASESGPRDVANRVRCCTAPLCVMRCCVATLLRGPLFYYARICARERRAGARCADRARDERCERRCYAAQDEKRRVEAVTPEPSALRYYAYCCINRMRDIRTRMIVCGKGVESRQAVR